MLPGLVINVGVQSEVGVWAEVGMQAEVRVQVEVGCGQRLGCAWHHVSKSTFLSDSGIHRCWSSWPVAPPPCTTQSPHQDTPHVLGEALPL